MTLKKSKAANGIGAEEAYEKIVEAFDKPHNLLVRHIGVRQERHEKPYQEAKRLLMNLLLEMTGEDAIVPKVASEPTSTSSSVDQKTEVGPDDSTVKKANKSS